METVLSYLPFIVLNLVALGIFSGHLTKLLLRIKPPVWSEGFTIVVLWFSAAAIVLFDLIFVLFFAGGQTYS